MKIAIIGAGPAGMSAAIAASEQGHDVVLFEKNEKIGKKLYITGKGRCNFTNASDLETIVKNVVTNQKFLYSSLKRFGSEDAMNLMESAGIPLKVERGNRVFPVSDKSSDVIKGFDLLLKRSGVTIRLNEEVLSLVTVDERVVTIKTKKADYDDFDAVIVATGGVSYPLTGSTGDGYRFASSCGHTIVTLVPSLVGIYTDRIQNGNRILDYDRYKLQGITLKNVSVTAYVNGIKVQEDFGEALFTDKGLSGPIILTLSSKLNRCQPKSISLSLDLKPALDEEKLNERILRDVGEAPNKDFKNFLRGFLPAGMVPLYADLTGVPLDKKVNTLTKEERKHFVSALKGAIFHVCSLEPIERAVVTSGGVSVKEIDAKTMRSKLVSNLYFAGEVIDVDALTGGFNIQIALSTGYAAGSQL